MRDSINFMYSYFKLQQFEYTKIMGKSAFNEFEEDQIIDVKIKGQFDHKAILIKKQLLNLEDLEIEILQMDSSYDEFQIKTYQDYIEFLNSLRKSNKISESNPELMLLCLMKYECPFCETQDGVIIREKESVDEKFLYCGKQLNHKWRIRTKINQNGEVNENE